MKRMLSGIKPTGRVTLGNYIGAIKPFVSYQDEYEMIVFVANLHSMTIYQEPKELRKNTRDLIALYLAAGLDPEKVTLFLQSDVLEHAQLGWYLGCMVSMGELSRMTQFKDKSRKNANFTTGLLTYPVLMAADILAYDVDYVPVGIDQKQHVELARDIAERFNKKYGETFKLPEALISSEGTKIMDLVTPDKKMSKSSESQKGVIRLLDDEKTIRKKIMGATTDSETVIKYDPENKPGISNLINIYISFTGKTIKEVEEEFAQKTYGEFKTKVADVVIEEISQIQKRYNEIINNNELDKILDEGREFTRKIAKKKYEDMKYKMGFRR